MLEPTKRTPKVLFIRNVFLHDCIEIGQSIESKLLDMSSSSMYTTPPCEVIQPYDSALVKLHSSTSSQIAVAIPMPNLMELDRDYQKLPRVFESFETWPKSTNLHCWYCSNQFAEMPKFIPLVIEPNVHSKYEDKYIIEVEATCCRWPCGVSYIYETTKDLTKAIEKINNLYFLYKLFTGKYPAYIPAAPNKYMQVQFGGDVTQEQYYKLYDELELQHNI